MGKSLKSKIKPRKLGAQKRAIDTVNSILTAATHILEKTSFEKTNTNHIAKLAGVSIGSLYQYFPSKESIYFKLIESDLEKYFRNLNDHIIEQEYNSFNEFVDELIDYIFEIMEERKSIRKFLYYFLPRGVASKIHTIEDRLEEIIFKKIESFDELNHLENKKIKVFMLIHSLTGVVHSSLAPKREVSIDEIKKQFKILAKSYFKS